MHFDHATDAFAPTFSILVASLKLYRTNRVKEYFQLNVTQHVVVCSTALG